jgi:NAD(P)-dependent dehydrogenase (short-subunit alcohol dehydrogenase family)
MSPTGRLVAVVTGAGSGVGQATAVALAERDLEVCCVGRRADPLAETVEQLGGRGRAVTADVGTATGVAAIADVLGAASVVALVHAAAIEGIVAFEDTDRAAFDRLVATNLAGPFFLTQSLRPMLTDGAGVVFVGSVSATHGRDRHAAYAATKAGLLGLTTSLAVELGLQARVNCVAPGAVDTPMFAAAITEYLGSMGEAQRDLAVRLHPLAPRRYQRGRDRLVDR